MTKKLKNKTQPKFFLTFLALYFLKGPQSLQEKPLALKKNIQHFKKINL
jgi:hypothetical protein